MNCYVWSCSKLIIIKKKKKTKPKVGVLSAWNSDSSQNYKISYFFNFSTSLLWLLCSLRTFWLWAITPYDQFFLLVNDYVLQFLSQIKKIKKCNNSKSIKPLLLHYFYINSLTEPFLESELYESFSPKCKVKSMSTLTSSGYLICQKHGRLVCSCEDLASKWVVF